MTRENTVRINNMVAGIMLASIIGAFTWIFDHNSRIAVQEQKIISLERRLEENREQTGKLAEVLHQLDKTMGQLAVEIRLLRENGEARAR